MQPTFIAWRRRRAGGFAGAPWGAVPPTERRNLLKPNAKTAE